MRKLEFLPDGELKLDGLLQCGRIYKDAEITHLRPRTLGAVCCFNVAASIKMRKCASPDAMNPRTVSLQCGRIYKDAEMRAECARMDTSHPRASMWPHL